MAININFDLIGNPEPLTIILANRNGNKLGQLYVDMDSIELNDKFNDASEFSFKLSKSIDAKTSNLWDNVVDFKLVYCKEWDMWFEISVEIDESLDTTKTVTCTQLGQAELSQIMLYNIEINTENDIARDDYKISILYDENDKESSILNRILEKAPHYSIGHVDNTISKIQRSFSFDGTSIYDSLQSISEEIGCLFDFPSNSGKGGKIQRTISAYDLYQNCVDCGHRGEFIDKCPKCGSSNIKYGYGDDTLIFVTSDDLASDGIQLSTDVNSVKNCFKLEAGDDLMTATVRNCNPNGTDYIWYFSDEIKEDMSDELVKKIESYNKEYKYYYNDFTSYTTKTLSKNEEKEFYVGKDFNVGDIVRFKCLRENISGASITYTDGKTICVLGFGGVVSEYSSIDLEITENIKDIYVNEYVEVYLVYDSYVENYNNLVKKYKQYNEELREIELPITGYYNLMNAYYNVIDLSLFLESVLMPSVEIMQTNAEEQAKLLTASSLSPVAVTDVTKVSKSTIDSFVLAMAKTIILPTYKVKIVKIEELDSNEPDSDNDGNKKYWKGRFIITNVSDDKDSATIDVENVEINDDIETFAKQKIEKTLNKLNADDLSISALFEKDYEEFCEELKKYALNPLNSIYEAGRACIDILIEQGIGRNKDSSKGNDEGNDETWSDDESGSDSNLYEKLYKPYYDKLNAIEREVKLREDEISCISGSYDIDGNIIEDGLLKIIEDLKNNIQDILDFESYLGEELWLEFCAYRREDKYSNENYISDGLNNAELFDMALKFFETAENEIYKSSELQHSISTTLNNLLRIKKFSQLVKYFKLGNWIRVRIDDKIYKLRLIEYNISYNDFNNIKVEFSDVTKIKNGITDVRDILSQASSMATSYGSVKRQADIGKKTNAVLNDWVENGLNATQTKIVNSVDESQLWSKDGFLCRQYDPTTGTYSDEQIKIINSTIAITDDNWKTTKTAIGKYYYYYTDPDTNKTELREAYGVNGETIVGKLLIGEQLDVSNETGNLEFGRNGLVVSNNKNTVTINPNDESIFNIKVRDESEENGFKDILTTNETGELIVVGNITANSLTLNEGVKIDSNKVDNLQTVAITGSYNDLSDKPSFADVATSGDYNDLSNAPTKLSQFSNDSEFITNDTNNLTNYYSKTELDSLFDYKADKDGLSDVATSGSYSDLVDIEELKNWVLEQIQSAIG